MSFGPRFSGDARFVAFSSYVDGLVAGDANGKCDVFVRVLATQTTEIVSVDSHGSTGNGRSQSAVISRGGDWVAFESDATNLVASDGNGVTDVFLRDRGLGTTERVSVDSAGNEGDGPSAIATSGQGISADGRFVAIVSYATNLVANNTNGSTVFVRDRTTGTTDRVSVDSAGGEANGFCSDAASLSLDGGIAFLSAASNLVASDANQQIDIFLHDRATGTTERVSVSSQGAEADDRSYAPRISADAAQVCFLSDADNLVPGDDNGGEDVFFRDVGFGTTRLVEIDWIQGLGEGDAWVFASSDDARVCGFYSADPYFVAGDTNARMDSSTRRRAGSITFRLPWRSVRPRTRRNPILGVSPLVIRWRRRHGLCSSVGELIGDES